MFYHAADQVTVVKICLLPFLQKNSILNIPVISYAGKFSISCSIFSNVISLVLRNSDMDSENVNLIQHSVLDGQKTCSSKSV